jgi:hypothetical protein
MRYMMLIYSREESPGGRDPDEIERTRSAHWKVIDEATRKGVFLGAEPLAPIITATTVRMQDGKALVTDGPFAETKEQLAGYYMLECENLDEAIEWAAKIPVTCRGREGCIEIRPMPGLPERVSSDAAAEPASVLNG